MIARIARIFRTPDAFAILFLIVWQFGYFFPVTLGQSVWFTTDILRLTYPFALELQRNPLPLWTDKILAGFPLFAEGQVAALYPLNQLLLKILPAPFALSLGVLIHLASGACGMYLFVRALGLRVTSALLAGFIFSFNGWVFGHLSHVGVIAAISWLPWSLYFLTRWQKSRVGIWFALIAISIALMYLSGSVQLAFLNSLAFLAIGAIHVGAGLAPALVPASTIFSSAKEFFLSVALPFLLGLGIAATQLVPTAELVGYSVRSGTDADFSTSYSLPLEFLQQFVAPFFQGEPSEGTGEYWAYIAFAPLLLMLLAPFLKRDRRTTFYFLFALVALSLALGENNPLFSLLYRLPIFGLFRVPARYLYLFTFAAAICDALALDALAEPLKVRTLSRFSRRFAFFALLTFALFVFPTLAHTQPLETWLALWRFLPFILGIFSIIILALAFKQKIAREDFLALILGLTLFDLALYAPPFLKTIDELSPVSAVATQPRSLPIFQSAPARGYTDISVFPSVPSLRASMYPNIGMVYGVPSAQAYTSLSFGRHEAFLSQTSPAMLNLLNARWFTVPLEPRPSGNRLTPPDNFYFALRDEPTPISPTLASAIEMASFTEQAEKISDGTAVAEIEITFRDGVAQKFPLRVGIETADWDYERKGLSAPHAPFAHSFPAFWRSFGKAFDGHTYLARFDFPTREVTSMRLRVLDPNVGFNLERITLLDARAQPKPLAALAYKNNFALAYLSDTVAIWENQDAMPRAFITHGAEIADDSAAFARMQDSGFEPRSTVWLSEGRALPRAVIANDAVEITQSESERVTVRAQTSAAGYLVLADSWYPGWNAYVDGAPAPIYRADVLFRAVPLEPGSHTVVFEYRPLSLIMGAGISLVSLAATFAIAFALRRKNKLDV